MNNLVHDAGGHFTSRLPQEVPQVDRLCRMLRGQSRLPIFQVRIGARGRVVSRIPCERERQHYG
jgi:hypothetical protein